jgi:aerotaxis receptor
MRINLPITNHSYELADGAALVSRTDLKGRITYANPSFVEVSGYTIDELVGKAHNIVRHPDMPPEAFADMWDSLGRGLPWTGLVKNRRKNGDFYWVQANVTPLRNQGRTEGYMSVRSKPEPAQVARAEQVYSRIRQGQAAGVTLRQGEVLPPIWADPLAALRRIPVRHRIVWVTALAALLTLVGGVLGWRELSWVVPPAGSGWLPGALVAGAVLSALAWAGLGYFLVRAVFRPLDKAVQVAQAIAGGELMKFDIQPADGPSPCCVP